MTIIDKSFDVNEISNNSDKPFAGTINNWFPETSFGYTLVNGDLDHDELHRFHDGTFIHTSYLVAFHYDTEKQEGWITTRNTRYNLGPSRSGYDIEKFFS